MDMTAMLLLLLIAGIVLGVPTLQARQHEDPET